MPNWNDDDSSDSDPDDEEDVVVIEEGEDEPQEAVEIMELDESQVAVEGESDAENEGDPPEDEPSQQQQQDNDSDTLTPQAGPVHTEEIPPASHPPARELALSSKSNTGYLGVIEMTDQRKKRYQACVSRGQASAAHARRPSRCIVIGYFMTALEAAEYRAEYVTAAEAEKSQKSASSDAADEAGQSRKRPRSSSNAVASSAAEAPTNAAAKAAPYTAPRTSGLSDEMAGIIAMLQGARGLECYAAKFEEVGWDDYGYLCSLEEAELTRIGRDDICMKPGHLARWVVMTHV